MNLRLPIHTAVFEMDNQQGPTAQHRELCCVIQPECKGSLGGNGYMYVYGWVPSLFYETITTLFISYIPIQNKKFFKKPSCLKEAVSKELYKNYTQYSGAWIRSGPCLPLCYTTMVCKREGLPIKSSVTIKIAIILPVQRSLNSSEIQKVGQTSVPLICYNFLYVSSTITILNTCL